MFIKEEDYKMVTLVKSACFVVDGHLEGEQEFRGLSTDAKPTDAVNGAAFIEVDTGDVYMFDGENWNEI